MKERLAALARTIWTALRWVGRNLWAGLLWLGRLLSRWVRLLGVGREVRAKQRERRRVLEDLGAMVYLLHQRSLVRNHDLLVECEKIRDIDCEIDQLVERGDQIRTEKHTVSEPPPRLADQDVVTPAGTDTALSYDPQPLEGDATADSVSA